MKILSLFLCLLINLELFTVCKDAVHIEKEMTTASFDKHADKDVCSPFCQCACCATSTVTEVRSLFSRPGLTAQTSFKELIPAGFIEVSLSVWQPPQLV